MKRLSNPRHIRKEVRKIKKLCEELLEYKDLTERISTLATERLYEKIGEKINKLEIDDYHNSVEKQLRAFRNEIAHDGDVTKEDLKRNKSFVSRLVEKCTSWLSDLFSPTQKSENFERGSLKGTREERTGITDAILDQLENGGEDGLNLPISENLSSSLDVVQDIINNENVQTLTNGNPDLAGSITDEILTWIKGLWHKMVTESPFDKEKQRFEEICEMPISAFMKERTSLVEEVKGFNPDMDMNFFEKKAKELDRRVYYKKLYDKKKPKISFEKFREQYKEEIRLEKEALKANFQKEWANILKMKTAQHELELIDQERKKFTKELYKKIDQFQSIKDILQPFSEDLGRLWDMSGGNWQNTNFNALLKYTQLLEKKPQLQTLAAKLGRYRRVEADYEMKVIQETKIRYKWKPNKAMKSEMVGITTGNKLQYALPHELALLSRVDTRPLFMQKMAEKELLMYDLKGVNKTAEEYQEEKKRVRKPKDKGPFIICVDTSGSMHGTPEEVAKILCLAILKQSLDENRPCYLISFSTAIQTMELTKLADSMADLVQFLEMSFHGGTDATPAINEGLKMMEKNEYKDADLLMISDFVMPQFSEEMTEKLGEAKKRKNRFYSLSIGNSGNTNAMNGFDENWIYDPTNPNSLNQLVEQMNTLKD